MMRQSGRTAGRLARALACAGLGLFAGCILDLERLPSCGDGYVDEDLGEECDPGVDASCDPTNCRKVEATCGNGRIDPGEECDHTDVGNKTCQSGQGYLSCNADCTLDESTCDPCGNGDIDPGEECDPRYVLPPGGDFADPIQCAKLSFPLKPYTTGVVTQCTNQCTWYRGPCGYCGDNETDPPSIIDLKFPEAKTKDEWCDGEDAPMDRLSDFCDSKCPDTGLQCKAQCLGDCSAFDTQQISAEELQCCLPAGSDCPTAGDPAPCCFAYKEGLENKFDTLAACFPQSDRQVCR